MSSNAAFITHPDWGEVTIVARFEGFFQVKDLGGQIRRVNPDRLSYSAPVVAINSAVMQQSQAAEPPPKEAPNINEMTPEQISKAVNLTKIVARRIVASRPPQGFASLDHLRESVGDVSLSDDAIKRLEGLRYEIRPDESR